MKIRLLVFFQVRYRPNPTANQHTDRLTMMKTVGNKDIYFDEYDRRKSTYLVLTRCCTFELSIDSDLYVYMQYYAIFLIYANDC